MVDMLFIFVVYFCNYYFILYMHVCWVDSPGIVNTIQELYALGFNDSDLLLSNCVWEIHQNS